MGKETVSRIMLTLLLTGTITLMFNPKIATVSVTQIIDWWPMFHHDPRHIGYSTSTAPDTNNTIWNYTTYGDIQFSSPAIANGTGFIGSEDKNVYAFGPPEDFVGEGRIYLEYDDGTPEQGWAWSGAGAMYAVRFTPFTSGRLIECCFFITHDPATVKVHVMDASRSDVITPLSQTPISTGWFLVDLSEYDITVSADVDFYVAIEWTAVYAPYLGDDTSDPDNRSWKYNNVEWSQYADGDYLIRAAIETVVTQTVDWWPMFHHDPCNTGTSTSKAPNTNNTIWNYTTGSSVYSSPAVVDGRVYFGSRDNNVYCLNATTGAYIWSYTTGAHVLSSPAVADGKVFVGSYDRKVYCFGGEPIADADGPYLGYEGSPITFDASKSTDDGTIVLYEWDWNHDGTYDENTTSPFINHTGADDYAGTVGLRVIDNDGLTDTDTASVTVNNVAPTVDAGAEQVVDEGDVVSLGPATFNDKGTLDTHTATINWGDGTATEAGTVNEIGGSGTVSGSHVYADNGTYTVTLKVTDDDGGLGIDTLQVTVNNVPPTVEAGPDQTVNVGEVVNFSGSFTDPGWLDTHTIFWDFGDDTNTTGTLTPTHTYVDTGTYTVTLKITDDDDGVGIDTLTVTVHLHDIAVTSVTPSKTVVGQGYSVSINVTIENQGDFTESFNVSVFYDDTAIILPDGKNHTTTTLLSLNSTTLTIPWNTTGIAKGNYTIKAKAHLVLGEADTLDNIFTDGWVLVTIPGDVNGDRMVDMADKDLINYYFGEPCSAYPNADVNCDCSIDMADIDLFNFHFGESW